MKVVSLFSENITAPATVVVIPIPPLIQGSVPFAGSLGFLTEDNSNFFWDDTNKRLGIGTDLPGTSLDVNGTATVTSLIIDGVAGNSLIVDSTTLVVDAINHKVGLGTATPGYKLTVEGGGEVDF